MPPPEGKITDHKFGNKLDNRVSQLRYATDEENRRNGGKHSDNTSGYKGVSWDKVNAKWHVGIAANGKYFNLGRFSKDKIIEAAKAYDAAAIKYHGEYARLNFPAVS